jgi:transcriptional regulator with XRE-family HTH domain
VSANPRQEIGLSRDHHETSRQHREYLKRVLEHMGMKPTPLAKAAGVSASSLVRLLKEDSTSTLHARTLSKLEKFSGISLSAVVDAPPAPGLRGLAEEAVSFDAESADPAVSDAIRALVANREAVPRTIRTRALECLGYLPGDTVIVELGRRPEPGDVVWAQISNVGRSDAEMVMRIYEPPILAAATLDERLRRPFMLDARVTIKGVVLPHRLRGAPTALIG